MGENCCLYVCLKAVKLQWYVISTACTMGQELFMSLCKKKILPSTDISSANEVS